MDLCIKTHDYLAKKLQIVKVSILVLMDLCIKTLDDAEKWIETKKQENINGGSNETN